MRRLCPLTALLIVTVVPAAKVLAAAADPGPMLVILTDTGQTRDGIPVFALHPDPEPTLAVLSRGFSGRMLRLYQFEQQYLERVSGARPEPAYLLLSGTQGGFPRFGFYLQNDDKRAVGYVDLHRSGQLAGRFGAKDQIFPHELAHIIVRQLAGEPRAGGSNQMHATGVRTDPSQAFQEGFAEHVQIMAVEDPDAEPATAALRDDARTRELSERMAINYRRDLQARWPFPGPTRMSFLAWFSGIEQVWRYFAIRENAFARDVPIPERMLAAEDLYPAYLLQNTIPGNPNDGWKKPARMLSIEGVAAALFYRWATAETVRRKYRAEEFYALFGTRASEVSPVENAYLKMFYVLHASKPQDTAAFIRAYVAVFPEEAGKIESIVQGIFGGQGLPTSRELWVANREFHTGTSLFDQFRRLPRTHTFDLNAATLVDLLSVPGMTRPTAERVLQNAPYANVEDLRRVSGVSTELAARFAAMAKEMDRMQSDPASDEGGIDLAALLKSYLWRALAILAAAAAGGLFLFRWIRPCGPFRAAANGFAASLLVLILAWLTTGTAAPIAFAGPILVFGLPSALWQWFRHRGPGVAARSLVAWAAAAVPAALLAYPWL